MQHLANQQTEVIDDLNEWNIQTLLLSTLKLVKSDVLKVHARKTTQPSVKTSDLYLLYL